MKCLHPLKSVRNEENENKNIKDCEKAVEIWQGKLVNIDTSSLVLKNIYILISYTLLNDICIIDIFDIHN